MSANELAKILIESFLELQKKLYEFIRTHPEMCVHVDPNFTHIGMCGHRKEPHYYRIADVNLYGNYYQICCCAVCGGIVSFIPYPDGWEASPDIPGVPVISANIVEIDRLIQSSDSVNDDFNPCAGVFRDEDQFAAVVKYEMIEKKHPIPPKSILSETVVD
jgi:hypothetical protein